MPLVRPASARSSRRVLFLLLAPFFPAWGTAVSASPAERQLTQPPHGRILTNTAAWSPDSHWLAYDLRADPAHFTGNRIEAVHVESGETRLLYQAPPDSHCGVVTWHPSQLRLAFIQGPEPETPGWPYGFARRRGVLLELPNLSPGQPFASPPVATALDAHTYAPPFVPGALRGGSHVHVFHPAGDWISYTYDDHVLASLDAALPPGQSPRHHPNQRNIAVSVPAGPVTVPLTHPRNHGGTWFSTVVSRTTAQPRPGSDEISRACEEGWVGHQGYLRAEGSRQSRALAFQGTVLAADGQPHVEVFLLDLPDDLTRPGHAPLEGTTLTYPAPPAGVVQRRLTHTDHRSHRGDQNRRQNPDDRNHRQQLNQRKGTRPAKANTTTIGKGRGKGRGKH